MNSKGDVDPQLLLKILRLQKLLLSNKQSNLMTDLLEDQAFE
jgi:hypothetical protein